jgi:hypothetical protein
MQPVQPEASPQEMCQLESSPGPSLIISVPVAAHPRCQLTASSNDRQVAHQVIRSPWALPG